MTLEIFFLSETTRTTSVIHGINKLNKGRVGGARLVLTSYLNNSCRYYRSSKSGSAPVRAGSSDAQGAAGRFSLRNVGKFPRRFFLSFRLFINYFQQFHLVESRTPPLSSLLPLRLVATAALSPLLCSLKAGNSCH